MEKSKQISTIIKYQKKTLSLFVQQKLLVVWFLEQVKIILKCFQKNVNILLKTKNALNDNREIPSDDSDQENSDVENQIQNVSATKTKNSRI